MGSWQCGAENHKLRMIKAPKQSSLGSRVQPLIVDDGWSFQHFIDGVLPKLFNSFFSSSIDGSKAFNQTLTLIPSPLQPIVKQMINNQLSSLSISEIEQLALTTNSKTSFYCSDILQFSCNAPSFHPFLYRRIQDTLSMNGIQMDHENDRNEESNNDNFILFLDRIEGKTKNGNREIVNRDELIESMNEIATNSGWKMKVFDHSEFDSIIKLVAFMKRVKVIVGAHGGAFYNLFFADRSNLKAVIEFVSVQWLNFDVSFSGSSNVFWITSSLLDVPYYRILSNGTAPNIPNVIVDIPSFHSLLSQLVL